MSLSINGTPVSASNGGLLAPSGANPAPFKRFALPDPATLDDAAFAHAILAPLTVGLNLERWRPMAMSWQGRPLRSDTAYWQYLADLRVTHVRLTFPYRPSRDVLGLGWYGDTRPPVSHINAFLDMAETAIAGGLFVFLNCGDGHGDADLRGARSQAEAHLSAMAEQIALRGPDRLPPTRFAVGPYATLEVAQDPYCNEVRAAAHRILRACLPNHALLTGVGGWGLPSMFDGWEPPPDQRAIVDWHDFPGLPSPSYVQGTAETVAQAVGPLPSVLGEISTGIVGFDPSWVALIDRYASYQPLARPCYWCVSDGGFYNLGSGPADLTLLPPIASVLTAASLKVRVLPAWQEANGNPAAPE